MKHLLLVALLVSAPAFAEDDLERSVAMMAKVGAATSPTFSPDGKRIAFITGISGVLDLPVLRETTNAAGQVVRQVRDTAGNVVPSPRTLGEGQGEGRLSPALRFRVRPDQ